MDGNGGGSGTATPSWDLGTHWAPAGSSGYPQPFAPLLGGGPSLDQQQHQQEQTWLNLGKQPCCWAGAGGNQQAPQPSSWGHVHGNGGGTGGGSGAAAAAEGKRKEKAAAPRCQVEGCHVLLAGAKEYHRRHKVCEAHSKAPRVVVLGAEQRFCQQCSRFHALSEFDDAKRSCRRRLAGHNERRRKSSASETMARTVGHPHGLMPFGHGFFPSSPAGALSLLSSARGGCAPWLIPATADISARSSAALDELIAENRRALLAWQFFSDHSPAGRLVPSSSTGRVLPAGEVPAGWHTAQIQDHPGGGAGRADDRYSFSEAPAGAGHTTLDLMQTPDTSAGAPFLQPVSERAGSARTPRKDGGDAGCTSVDAWASAEGAPDHVV